MSDSETKKDITRRRFLKATGATGAALGGAGLVLFGYEAGSDPGNYLGWQTHEGINQYGRMRSNEDH